MFGEPRKQGKSRKPGKPGKGTSHPGMDGPDGTTWCHMAPRGATRGVRTDGTPRGTALTQFDVTTFSQVRATRPTPTHNQPPHPLAHDAKVMPLWRHGPHAVCRQPPPRTRGGRRSRRRRSPRAGRAAHRPLESATRLTMLNVLSAAMDEITLELAPGSVDVRLRGLDPDFVVTRPATEETYEDRSGPAEPLKAASPGARRRRRRRHRPRQSAPARPPQDARRGGREPRGPVGQRVAGPSRVGRGRRRHPVTRTGKQPSHPHHPLRRTELHGLGALTAHPARPNSPGTSP